ncbi:MAG: hypothetical protein ABFD10_01200 [Prolixibacteraceae bacterium]
MTRKISHIIITFILVILTMGVSVSKHYCSGMLVKVSVFSNQVAGCQEGSSSCAMGDCCRNEHQVIQMLEKYVLSSVHDSVQFFPVVLTIIDLNIIQLFLSEQVSLNRLFLGDSPPPPDKMTILSGLQVFRL